MADFDYYGVSFSHDGGKISERAYDVDVATCGELCDPKRTLDELSRKDARCSLERNFLPAVASYVIENDIKVKDSSFNPSFVSKVEKARKVFRENGVRLRSAALGLMIAVASVGPLASQGYFDGMKVEKDFPKVCAYEVSNCLVLDAEKSVLKANPESVRDRKKYDSLMSESIRRTCRECDRTFELSDGNPVRRDFGLGEGHFDVRSLKSDEYCFDSAKGRYNCDFITDEGTVISRGALDWIHDVASGRISPEVSLVMPGSEGKLERLESRAEKAVREAGGGSKVSDEKVVGEKIGEKSVARKALELKDDVVKKVSKVFRR